MEKHNTADSRTVAGAGELPGGADPEGTGTGIMSLGKSLIGSVAGLGALVYAAGYLCHVGHHQMLGVSQVQYASEQVIHDGICFFALVPICVLLSLYTAWLPWVVLFLWAIALPPLQLLRRLSDRILRGRGGVGLSKVISAVVGLGLTVLFFLLASVVLSQRGLLFVLPGESAVTSSTSLFSIVTSHDDRLMELLVTGRSRSLYGLLFVVGAACLWWWGRYVVWLACQGVLLQEAKAAKRMCECGLLGLALYVSLLIVALLLTLYGFLVKSNEYPLVEIHRAQADSLPVQAFVLGHSASYTLLYWPGGPRPEVWWVEDTGYLPGLQWQPKKDLFEYTASTPSRAEENTSATVVDKQGSVE
jgi:hypothetical protein